VGAIGDVVAAAGTTEVAADHGVTDPMVPDGAAGAAGAAGADAGAGGADWFFNIVPKSVAEAGLRGFAGVFDRRRITGTVYAGRVAVLNVGMT
jgi:hypothetical protein